MDLPSTSNDFPGFERFFCLDEPGDAAAYRGRLSISVDDAFASTRGEIIPRSVRVDWAMGGVTPSDFVFATTVAAVIVSDRVVGVLTSHGFRGWGVYPLRMFTRNGTEVLGYSGLSVVGRCGPIDNSRSEKFMKRMPGGTFPRWRGLRFDETSWDGSDFFIPRGKGATIFVVDAVKNALEEARIRNVDFARLDEIERSVLYP